MQLTSVVMAVECALGKSYRGRGKKVSRKSGKLLWCCLCVGREWVWKSVCEVGAIGSRDGVLTGSEMRCGRIGGRGRAAEGSFLSLGSSGLAFRGGANAPLASDRRLFFLLPFRFARSHSPAALSPSMGHGHNRSIDSTGTTIPISSTPQARAPCCPAPVVGGCVTGLVVTARPGLGEENLERRLIPSHSTRLNRSQRDDPAASAESAPAPIECLTPAHLPPRVVTREPGRPSPLPRPTKIFTAGECAFAPSRSSTGEMTCEPPAVGAGRPFRVARGFGWLLGGALGRETSSRLVLAVKPVRYAGITGFSCNYHACYFPALAACVRPATRTLVWPRPGCVPYRNLIEVGADPPEAALISP